MPVEWLDYDSGSAEWNDLVRYPTRAIGSAEWVALPDLTTVAPAEQVVKAMRWLRKLQSASPPSRRCPRIFIAHLEADRLAALKMARIVSECGFHFWLDVLDSQVKRLGALPPAVQTSVGTSAVIEMAMLNCTHMVAIGQTSPWIDFAFGRIRTRAAYLWQLGSWPGRASGALGLGLNIPDKAAIQEWLNAEFGMTLGCPRRSPISWAEHPAITNDLP